MLSCLLTRRVGTAIILLSLAVVALGLAPAVAGAADPASSSGTTVLEQGTGLGGPPSRAVRRVQQTLTRRGYDLGRPGVDGRFGPLTAAAVRRLQTRYGLSADGVVGSKTRRVLALLDRVAASGRRSDRPRSTRTTPTPPPARRTAPPAARQPSPTVAPAATRGADGAGSTPALVLAALAAALAALAFGAALRLRRQRDAIAVTSIDRELYLEGESAQPEVGAFRGYALATAVPSGRGADLSHARYLVDDPHKPVPVWVDSTDVSRSPAQLARGGHVIGYVTAGADPVAEQQEFLAIEDACDEAGWRLDDIICDRDTGRMVGRPGLTGALERIAAGDAQGLVVSDVRALARSLPELGGLLEWFRDAGAALVALDLEIDTATVHGHQTASTLIAVASWERERASARARRGLARVQSPDRASVATTRDSAESVERIHGMRAAGLTPEAIAEQLAREGVPPLPRDRRWSAAAVRRALEHEAPDRSIRDELPAIPPRRQR
jgi:DNA invertase Pin-like site-specific DNA recombinase/peptidoglycan hydrolase-like protein with peptidoglycan-binding domain